MDQPTSTSRNTRAMEILDRIIYLTIASVSQEGQPWSTPVFFAYDEHYNLYWGSHVNSQHSKNIQNNPRVGLVIYDSTIPPGEGEGVYIQATASEILEESEIVWAHKLLQGRRPVPYWKLEHVQKNSPVHLYKATPKKIWMNGEGESDGVYIDTREEVKL